VYFFGRVSTIGAIEALICKKSIKNEKTSNNSCAGHRNDFGWVQIIKRVFRSI
jgi:hypothetical protein